MRPSEVVESLQCLSDAGLPGMMWGSPGIGKSSIVNQLGKNTGRKVFDIRLALLDPTDLRGIPFYNPTTQTAEWASASILPKVRPEDDDEFARIAEHIKKVIEEDETAIIFLDEINAAPPSIQAAAYQLVLDRCIGDYKLPDGVSIVAAGNREGDKAVTFKMPTPLLNRFVHIDFEIDFDDWLEWAIQNKISADVIGYLNFKKGMLNKFDPKSNSRGFPTPRTWSYVSDLLNGKSMSEPVLRGLVGGTVGEGAAIEFMSYRKVYLTLPNPADVLDGKITKMPADGNDLSSQYAMITSLSYELDNRFKKLGKTKEFHETSATYFTFIDNNFSPEYCIMGVRDCIKSFKLPMLQATNWKMFAKDYASLVMAA